MALYKLVFNFNFNFIDQKSASVTHRSKAVKFACVTMHSFAGEHKAIGKSRILALLTFNLWFKFHFTFAFFVLLLGFRLTVRAIS